MNRKKTILLVVLSLFAAIVLFVLVAQRTTTPITIERVLDAPVAKVWLYWNDPDWIKQWWSPRDFTAPVIKNDLRVGGEYLFSMRAPDGKMFWNRGTYTEVVIHRRIVSNQSFADENGNAVSASHYKLPGNWPKEINVKIEFEEEGNKTRVRVRETGIPLVMYVFAKLGWHQQFDKLDNLLK